MALAEAQLAKDGVKLGREWLIRSPVIGSFAIALALVTWAQYKSYQEIQEQNKMMFSSLQDLHVKTNAQLVDLTRDSVKSNAELKAAVESMKDLIRDQRVAERRRGEL